MSAVEPIAEDAVSNALIVEAQEQNLTRDQETISNNPRSEDTPTFGHAHFASDSSRSPVEVNTSAWTHALVMTGRLYAVYEVPRELRSDLHEGDLVACESGRGSTAGILIKDVSTLVRAPGAMPDRVAESVGAPGTTHVISRNTSAGTNDFSTTSCIDATHEGISFIASDSHHVDPSADSTSPLTPISRSDSAQASPPTSPLYSQRLETGLQMDHCLVRLPRIHRRGVNRDKKKLYYSQRRSSEALQCVLQRLEERMLTGDLMVDEVEYQVDFVVTTVHLAGHPNENGHTDERYHRFGQLLTTPLRTQIVEFRHTVVFPEQLHRTRYFFSDEVNRQLRSFINDSVRRAPSDSHSAQIVGGSERVSKDGGASIGASRMRVLAAPGGYAVASTQMPVVSSQTFTQAAGQSFQFTQPMQMVPLHTSASPSFYPQGSQVQPVYAPLTMASGSTGLPLLLPQSSSLPMGSHQAVPHELTLVEVPHWTQMPPTLIPFAQPSSTEYSARTVSSPQHSHSGAAPVMGPNGNISLGYPSFPTQNNLNTSSLGSSMVFCYQVPQTGQGNQQPYYLAYTSPSGDGSPQPR